MLYNFKEEARKAVEGLQGGMNLDDITTHGYAVALLNSNIGLKNDIKVKLGKEAQNVSDLHLEVIKTIFDKCVDKGVVKSRRVSVDGYNSEGGDEFRLWCKTNDGKKYIVYLWSDDTNVYHDGVKCKMIHFTIDSFNGVFMGRVSHTELLEDNVYIF